MIYCIYQDFVSLNGQIFPIVCVLHAHYFWLDAWFVSLSGYFAYCCYYYGCWDTRGPASFLLTKYLAVEILDDMLINFITLSTCVCVCVCLCVCVRERQRETERDRETQRDIHTEMCVCVCVWERERDRDRDRERDREKQRETEKGGGVDSGVWSISTVHPVFF